ncbi:MAG: phosphatidylglycerol:prolipoprotein diacylglycerol transferase [Candidatus Peribacter riflensis]|uniref:Phosphatidylglycerol--prolipoprotein diacylglyceryl transferase n=1 Tax=Candidatus Peribacter riflensis TaxID=1735162 RepID=A0A0S1SPA5_9BACT|nr:MAG: phosphatidylglycerol:prolipoprotein diacylglycerol transferase [Candidatus Peribacter riflensis]OGJ77067.1 MAG: prolipoprotein diacylglyceryl transferase [Candidatus Peribacteria bacterium RIFOXYB1_FULL_57_12]OGJ79080.1 MAG: prolipoprotein diacylglyceryl transferase [Candidatus Peribacteria bacterium RIFOXYC1_FULL_58_8]ALM11016.1 MAG: prolipoprotein diacylglyceryl transferase [Candidatus Peribacter riflensis]ALM12119.1 MAG: phosphatidylglycerol:prolipoprotein diacylglycerol transferase 
MLTFFPSRTVAVALFGFPIHWYGLLYVAAFLLAFLILPRIQKQRGLALSSEAWADLLTAGILGVLIGGRLGFVLFYHPLTYAAHPFEILAVWRGGMSSHGGFIGVGIALWFAARRQHIPLSSLLDLVVIPAAAGLALGRVGNFINLELYGTVTTLPFGMAIPGVEGLRHPVQLYAFLKDLLIAFLCLWHLHRTRMLRPGGTFALFLILYGALRFCVEFVRVPDSPTLVLPWLVLSKGQLYSLPLFLLGVGLWWRWRRGRYSGGSGMGQGF